MTNTVDLNAFLHNNPVSMQELSSTDIINQILKYADINKQQVHVCELMY
ncbi:MAG: hypothetical protein ACJ71L_14650 [Nitrososphaeraceae archaeon]